MIDLLDRKLKSWKWKRFFLRLMQKLPKIHHCMKIKQMGIMLEIEKESHGIVNVEATFITSLAQRLFQADGCRDGFCQDISSLLKNAETDFIIPSQHNRH